MTVARISIMRTSRDLTHTASDKRVLVEALLDELEEHLSNLMGFHFIGHEDEDEVGRVALWNTHQDADHAALQDHTVALRARIHQLIDPGHTETLVELAGTSKNLPAARS